MYFLKYKSLEYAFVCNYNVDLFVPQIRVIHVTHSDISAVSNVSNEKKTKLSLHIYILGWAAV